MFLHVFSQFFGVKLNKCVEVAEHEDKENVEGDVQGTAKPKNLRDALGPRVLNKLRDHLGEEQQRRGEDYRDNPSLVHLEGDVRGLPAIHLAPHNPFRILHRHFALAFLYKNHAGDDK